MTIKINKPMSTENRKSFEIELRGQIDQLNSGLKHPIVVISDILSLYDKLSDNTPDTGVMDEGEIEQAAKLFVIDILFDVAEVNAAEVELSKQAFISGAKWAISRLPVSGESAGEEKKGKGFNDTCQRCGSKFDDVLGIGHCYKCSK